MPPRRRASGDPAAKAEFPLAVGTTAIEFRETQQMRSKMLKFYYSGAPNPTKVALFLEETGLPYEAVPVDTRKGEQHKPEFLAINPNAKLPAIVDGDVDGVRFKRDPALSRREDRQVSAGQDRQGARRAAVVDVLRVVRRRPVFRPGGAFPQLRAGEDPLRHQPLRLRGAAPRRHSRCAARQAEIHARRHLHDRRHERVGLGAACCRT